MVTCLMFYNTSLEQNDSIYKWIKKYHWKYSEWIFSLGYTSDKSEMFSLQ